MSLPDSMQLAIPAAPARAAAKPLTPAPSVELVGESAAEEWDRFLRNAEGGSAYHTYAWRRVVGDFFGHETYYLAARGEGRRIVGVLPLVRLRSRLFGDFLVSLPYFSDGGLVAENAAAGSALLDALVELARELGVSHAELRHRAPVPVDWPVRTEKVCMLLELPPTPEALLKSLPSKVRSQIKRPTREGAYCVAGGRELLDDFYRVFAENMRDLGTPVYPEAFFETILTSFPESSRVTVVRLGETPVAAGFTLRHRDTVEIPWASSLQRFNPIGVNMFLYWNVLERSVTEGARRFDFGRSTRDSGTFRFKKQWGAQPQQLYWHYWLPAGGEPPQLNPSNPRYRLAIAAWRRLPLSVANWLGPRLVRNLP